MDASNLKVVLQSLALRRPVFFSEADFQHSLAMELEKHYPGQAIYLEVPLKGMEKRGSLDILIEPDTDKSTAIELKYFKAAINYTHDGIRYGFPTGGARDQARHDVCKDITRVEHAIGTHQAHHGYVVVLTNDQGYWADNGNETVDCAFKIHDGRELSGVLEWSIRAGQGTKAKRERELALRGNYVLSWSEYSSLPTKNGLFKMLMIAVVVGQNLPMAQMERWMSKISLEE